MVRIMVRILISDFTAAVSFDPCFHGPIQLIIFSRRLQPRPGGQPAALLAAAPARVRHAQTQQLPLPCLKTPRGRRRRRLGGCQGPAAKSTGGPLRKSLVRHSVRGGSGASVRRGAGRGEEGRGQPGRSRSAAHRAAAMDGNSLLESGLGSLSSELQSSASTIYDIEVDDSPSGSRFSLAVGAGGGAPATSSNTRSSIFAAVESAHNKNEHIHQLTPREEEIMNAFEALDYDLCENKVRPQWDKGGLSCSATGRFFAETLPFPPLRSRSSSSGSSSRCPR